jgi:hypothetical protein
MVRIISNDTDNTDNSNKIRLYHIVIYIHIYICTCIYRHIYHIYMCLFGHYCGFQSIEVDCLVSTATIGLGTWLDFSGRIGVSERTLCRKVEINQNL